MKKIEQNNKDLSVPSNLDPKTISLISKSGDIYNGPIDQASDLVKSGDFRFLKPEEATGLSMKDFANTPTEQLKNVGSNYLSTASFGASDIAKRQMMSPEELKYEEVRRQENPVGSIAGVGAGVLMDPFSLGSLALKGAGSAAKAIGAEKVGSALAKGAEGLSEASKFAPTKVLENGADALATAANPLGEKIAGSLLSKETSPILNEALSKIPGRAIRGSTIGGAFAAGQSITEQSLGDTDLNGEKIFADGLNGAMLGGVLDSGVGAIGDLAVGGTKKIYGALKNNEALQNSYSKIISKFSGADEATVNATIQAEREAQAIYKGSEKDPTAVENLSTNIKQIFGDGSEGTQAQLGNNIKEGFSKIYSDLKSDYNNIFTPLREQYGEAPVNIRLGWKTFDQIDDQLVRNSPAQRILNQYKNNFLDLKNANDLFTLRSIITKELSMAGQKAESGLVGSLMRDAEDQSLIMSAKSTGDPVQMDTAKRASEAVAESRAAYAGDMKKLKSLSESLGLKRVRSFSDLIDRLSETDGNVLVDKMFKNRGNVQALEFLRKDFPDQFKTLTDSFKSKIAAKATKAAGFNPITALDLVSEKNLPPEVRKMVFGEAGHDALTASAKAFQGETAENFARNQAKKEQLRLLNGEQDNNYAKTGAILGSIGGIPGAGVGAAAGTVLDTLTDRNKAAKAFLGFEKAFKSFDDKIGTAAQKIFEESPFKQKDISRVLTTSKLTAEKSDRDDNKKDHPLELNHEEMTKNLAEWSENPDKLVEHMSSQLGDMNKVAPGMSQSTQATAYRAIDLLKEKLPVMPLKKPLDTTPYKVSNQEAFKFSRFYDTVMNPLGALKEVQKGTLNNDHLETLMRVYPQLYKGMQEILMMKMIDYSNQKDKVAMPPWKKLSLSLFLHNDLSEGLSQQSLGANFNNWLNPNMLSGQENSGAMSNSKGNQTGKSVKVAKNYLTDNQQAEQEVV